MSFPVGEGAMRDLTITQFYHKWEIGKFGIFLDMTLSEFSLQIRVVAKVAAFFFALVIFFYLLIMLLLNSLKSELKQEIALNPVFGSVKAPVFEHAQGNAKYNFELDTIDGKLPIATASARVFFIPEPKSTLAYLTKVDSLATSFGFDTGVTKPLTLNDEWVKYEDARQLLEVNIRSYHFRYRLKPGAELDSILTATPEAKFIGFESSLIEEAREALSSRESYPAHLAAGTTTPVYVRYDAIQDDYVPVKPEEGPQGIRVYFGRVEEDLEIATPERLVTQNYVTIAPLNHYSQVIEAEYLSFAKLDTDPGIYPLITSEEAFAKLKQGAAKTIFVDAGAPAKIRIKELYLAYYDPDSYQPYFQPIYVFLGNHNFLGYLPAIKDEYLVK